MVNLNPLTRVYGYRSAWEADPDAHPLLQLCGSNGQDSVEQRGRLFGLGAERPRFCARLGGRVWSAGACLPIGMQR